MDKPNINSALLSKRELNHRTFPRFVSLPNSCSNAFMFQSKYTYLTGFYLASRVQVGVGRLGRREEHQFDPHGGFVGYKTTERNLIRLHSLSIMQECSIASS
jgi:hypothetical protein